MRFVPAIFMMVRALLLCVAVFCLSSFDKKPCDNSNPIFTQYWPYEKEYKQELVRILRSPDTLQTTYWVESFSKKHDRVYMVVSIQDSSLCALGIIDVTDIPKKSKLKAFLEQDEDKCIGAELRGFRFRIDSTMGNYSFSFDHLDSIVQ